MKKQNKLNNKGFSLVELIVVIAIMAVLIGVLAPTLITKIEESREGADLQTLGEVRTQVINALADEEIYSGVTGQKFSIAKDDCAIDGVTGDAADKLKEELADVIGKYEFKSKSATKDDDGNCLIWISVDDKGKVEAMISNVGTTAAQASDDVYYFIGQTGNTGTTVKEFTTTTP